MAYGLQAINVWLKNKNQKNRLTGCNWRVLYASSLRGSRLLATHLRMQRSLKTWNSKVVIAFEM
jgi:hypothetical protein